MTAVSAVPAVQALIDAVEARARVFEPDWACISEARKPAERARRTAADAALDLARKDLEAALVPIETDLVAQWIERECRNWRCRGDVDESEAIAVDVLGQVLASGIKAGEWKRLASEKAGPLFEGVELPL